VGWYPRGIGKELSTCHFLIHLLGYGLRSLVQIKFYKTMIKTTMASTNVNTYLNFLILQSISKINRWNKQVYCDKLQKPF
jgi:hypothetical protein